ncbi:circadian clock KaiB family protein, partial [Lacisediminimonas sp.]|uniref:circadian clock KaiB family protein n=1 Tax=Lacisediminimonas sp. TaxID=3060582 RepID=UPI0027214A0D
MREFFVEVELHVPKFQFQLYVSGDTLRGRKAITALRQIIERELPGQCQVEVIDAVAQPDRAEDEKVLATPTLVSAALLPARLLVGDLSAPGRVLEGLRPLSEGVSGASDANAGSLHVRDGRYQALIEEQLAAVLILDTAGVIRFANAAAVRMFA